MDYLMLMEPTSHDNVLFLEKDSNDKAGLGEEIDVNFINVKLNSECVAEEIIAQLEDKADIDTVDNDVESLPTAIGKAETLMRVMS